MIFYELLDETDTKS